MAGSATGSQARTLPAEGAKRPQLRGVAESVRLHRSLQVAQLSQSEDGPGHGAGLVEHEGRSCARSPPPSSLCDGASTVASCVSVASSASSAATAFTAESWYLRSLATLGDPKPVRGLRHEMMLVELHSQADQLHHVARELDGQLHSRLRSRPRGSASCCGSSRHSEVSTNLPSSQSEVTWERPRPAATPQSTEWDQDRQWGLLLAAETPSRPSASEGLPEAARELGVAEHRAESLDLRNQRLRLFYKSHKEEASVSTRRGSSGASPTAQGELDSASPAPAAEEPNTEASPTSTLAVAAARSALAALPRVGSCALLGLTVVAAVCLGSPGQ